MEIEETPVKWTKHTDTENGRVVGKMGEWKKRVNMI